MFSIPFTQYRIPDGTKRSISIERPQNIYDKAMEIISAGYWFEAEELRTGEVN